MNQNEKFIISRITPPRQVIYLYINHLEQNNGLEFSRTQDHR